MKKETLTRILKAIPNSSDLVHFSGILRVCTVTGYGHDGRSSIPSRAGISLFVTTKAGSEVPPSAVTHPGDFLYEYSYGP